MPSENCTTVTADEIRWEDDGGAEYAPPPRVSIISYNAATRIRQLRGQIYALQLDISCLRSEGYIRTLQAEIAKMEEEIQRCYRRV